MKPITRRRGGGVKPATKFLLTAVCIAAVGSTAFTAHAALDPFGPPAAGDASAQTDQPADPTQALRESALALRPKESGASPGPTAIITHGANPGLVSHFVKKALVNLAKDTGLGAVKPTTREGWG